MPSVMLGKNTLEVTNISGFGFWILWNEREYFLSYEYFPWFKDARVKDIVNVQLESASHLYWPDLDIDLSLDILEHPEMFPLISK